MTKFHICRKCDNYGVVPGPDGVAIKCDEPNCPGYMTHAQCMEGLRKSKESNGSA